MSHIFSPTVVFCPHQEVAESWHTIEYGLEAHPPWGRLTGYVGPSPDGFFLDHHHPALKDQKERIFPTLTSFEDGQRLYDSIMSRPGDDMRSLGHECTKQEFRVVFILQAGNSGPLLGEDEKKQFLESVRFFFQNHDIPERRFQAIFILLQHKGLSSATEEFVEQIHKLITEDYGDRPGRCLADDSVGEVPPKVLFASTWDKDGYVTTLSELNYVAAAVTHLLCEQTDWTNSFLNKSGYIEGRLSPAIFGLRSFFWERVRAIDESRKSHFRDSFGYVWVEDGWCEKGQFPFMPTVGSSSTETEDDISPDDEEVVESWGVLYSNWTREIWRNLKKLMLDAEGEGGDWAKAKQANSIEDYRRILEKDLIKDMEKCLNNELDKAREKIDDPEAEAKAFRKILNVVTRKTDKGVSEKFKLIKGSTENVNTSFEKDFNQYHEERIREGTGLGLLMRHYRTLANKIERQTIEIPGRNETSFQTTEIMSLARNAILAQLARPHDGTVTSSWSLMFGFLTVAFFSLFEILNLSDTFISPLFGIFAALAIFYKIAYSKYDGRLTRVFSGSGWLLVTLIPLLGYGFYYCLQYTQIGNYLVHLISGASVALCISYAIVAAHYRTKADAFEGKRDDFNKKIKRMVRAVVNHKMVAATEGVMNRAKDVLNDHADALEKQIELAKNKIASYSGKALGYPIQPVRMEFVTMMNPSSAEETVNWEAYIAEETQRWAREFWRSGQGPSQLGSTENWWDLQFQKMSEISHRQYLLGQTRRQDEHQLGGELGLSLWRQKMQSGFEELSVQADVERGWMDAEQIQQVLCFHPSGSMAEHVDGIKQHVQEKHEADCEPIHIENLYNPSIVCLMRLNHGYSWNDVQKMTQKSPTEEAPIDVK